MTGEAPPKVNCNASREHTSLLRPPMKKIDTSQDHCSKIAHPFFRTIVINHCAKKDYPITTPVLQNPHNDSSPFSGSFSAKDSPFPGPLVKIPPFRDHLCEKGLPQLQDPLPKWHGKIFQHLMTTNNIISCTRWGPSVTLQEANNDITDSPLRR